VQHVTIANFVRALAVGVVVVYVIVAVRLVSDDNVGVAVEALAFYVPVVLLLLGLAAYLDARSSMG
jgi:hypothetical protein